MDLNKIPRWALVAIAGVGLLSLTTMISTARADLDKFKAIASQAKTVSDQTALDTTELKTDFRSFKTEYREDQKEMNAQLRDIARAVKA